MKRLLLVLYLLNALSFYGFASTFTVTSNADSGPGTLREAILQSTSDRTSLPNRIVFALPTATAADRIITITSELPLLSSDLIIDATTQAGNLPFAGGVTITRGSAAYFHCLRIENVQNVEVYGLRITNFLSLDNIQNRFAAIFVKNASNVTIGTLAKGNIFGNCGS